MKELLIAIASGLVEKPEEVTVVVDEPDEEGVIAYHLHVSENDMGRVIGKQNSQGYPCCYARRRQQRRKKSIG